MEIQIQDVSRSDATGKNGKSYGILQVAYRSDGKLQEKKLMSFSNPQVFKHIEGLSKGDVVNVKTEKDGNGYWQWTAIEDGTAAPKAATSNASAPTRVTGSNYETPEERAKRQQYIVRQSSLTTAISILGVGAKSLDKQQVLGLAEELEQWVFRVDLPKVATTSLEEMEDDIPY
jgi:hypothetical protein